MRHLLPLLLLCALSLPAGASDKRILAFGDSITSGCGDPGVICSEPFPPPVTGGYPPRLRSRLLNNGIDAEFVNRGLPGEKTGAGVSRIEGVLAEGGDVIMIMEGTNDVSDNVGVESILFNISEMARKAVAAGVEPIVISAIPRGPDSGRDSNNAKTRMLADGLEQVASQAGWVFADGFYTLFNRSRFYELYYSDPWHPNASGYNLLSVAFVDPALEAITLADLCSEVPPGPCVASDTVLCLNQGRFRLEVTWENFFGQSGVGHALPQTADTGAFYWVDPENVEMIIKVLDGRDINDHFWVFYGALSNLEFTLIVKDTETGECNEYLNPLGNFASVGDTAAFYAPLP